MKRVGTVNAGHLVRQLPLRRLLRRGRGVRSGSVGMRIHHATDTFDGASLVKSRQSLYTSPPRQCQLLPYNRRRRLGVTDRELANRRGIYSACSTLAITPTPQKNSSWPPRNRCLLRTAIRGRGLMNIFMQLAGDTEKKIEKKAIV